VMRGTEAPPPPSSSVAAAGRYSSVCSLSASSTSVTRPSNTACRRRRQTRADGKPRHTWGNVRICKKAGDETGVKRPGEVSGGKCPSLQDTTFSTTFDINERLDWPEINHIGCVQAGLFEQWRHKRMFLRIRQSSLPQ